MIDDLYQNNLLKLAALAIKSGNLKKNDATATLSNPLCGDQVSFDIRLKGQRVDDLAHRVKGCVLCQASASMISDKSVGFSLANLQDSLSSIKLILSNEKPETQWDELAWFKPVASHKSRHNCVLLPFQTLIAAFEKASIE